MVFNVIMRVMFSQVVTLCGQMVTIEPHYENNYI